MPAAGKIGGCETFPPHRLDESGIPLEPRLMSRPLKTKAPRRAGAKTAAPPARNLRDREQALRLSNEELEQRVRERTEAFRKSEILKQAVFDSIAAQIVVIDATGGIIDVNRTWEQYLGTDASASLEAHGRKSNYLEVCRRAIAEGHEGAAQIVETISAVFGGKAATGRVEYLGRPRHGRDQWFALTVTPLGAGAGAVLLHENISVQRQLESEILEISERERAQVGQELHDGLCQHLGGVALLAQTLANALTNATRPEAGQALDLAQLIFSAVGQIRTVARGLRPVELDEGGLLAALQDLAEQANVRVPCAIRANGEPRVNDNEVATNLYRIAHEALANAVKHSRATRIVIRLRQSSDHLTLMVEDDGDGLPADLAGSDGVGLRIMHYRANSIGARLSIKNRVTGGLVVTCSVPLETP
jgi:signal transduction histidine kinase